MKTRKIETKSIKKTETHEIQVVRLTIPLPYHIQFFCKLVEGSVELAKFSSPVEAVNFAKRKARILGLKLHVDSVTREDIKNYLNAQKTETK